PRVLLLHGWNSESRSMWPMAQALADQGLRVIVPDLPGEGANPYAVLSFTQKAEALALAYYETGFDAVISHSAGGLIAAQAIEKGLRTAALATICSPVSMATLLHAYLKRTAAPAATYEAILMAYARREQRQAQCAGPRVFSAYAGRMKVIHAQSDWQVKVAEAHDIGALAKTSPLLLDKCNHHTILSDSRTHDSLADFVRKAASRWRSHAEHP
ncbi:MAG: alpha/beta fold hydrolase, partial [Pseudomonadota bacterium]